MLDNRIYTFLELCKVMNYRKTAEKLNMTQPAVTQHVKYLEAEYGCKLFEYHAKVLTKTQQCVELEEHAKTLVYADKSVMDKLSVNPVTKIAIGATKSIGEYTIEENVMELLKKEEMELHLIIDNTQNLLKQLNNLELDILMLEGYFDKNTYGYQPIKKEEVVGICALEHPFAGQVVELEDVFSQHLIMREEGSGTRSIFDRFLESKNYSVESFRKKSVISSYRLIERGVENNLGISFVYSVVAKQERFATFRIKNHVIEHEFNYVYLKDVNVDELLNHIEYKV